jgi:hypothetical protein
MAVVRFSSVTRSTRRARSSGEFARARVLQGSATSRKLTECLPADRRMHTNATVTLSNNGATATLDLGGEQLIASIRSPSGAAFTTQTPAARLDSDPTTTVYNGETVTASADQPNPGVTVLMIDVAAGDQTLEVLFNVRRPSFSSFSPLFNANPRCSSPPTAAMARLVRVELRLAAERRARLVVAHLARVTSNFAPCFLRPKDTSLLSSIPPHPSHDNALHIRLYSLSFINEFPRLLHPPSSVSHVILELPSLGIVATSPHTHSRFFFCLHGHYFSVRGGSPCSRGEQGRRAPSALSRAPFSRKKVYFRPGGRCARMYKCCLHVLPDC